jgi:hypothetical protein
MAIGIFLIGVDEIDTVLAIRTALISNSLISDGGKTTVNYTSDGLTVTKQFTIPPIQLLRECNDFLRKADPDTYGRKVTRTRPRYYGY